jgi:hypothetical protein
MMMTLYAQLLEIAREQADLVGRGDLEAAIQALDARAELLAAAPEPSPADLAVIRETLTVDRELSSAIRARMIELRAEALHTQRGRGAVRGYGSGQRNLAELVDYAV